MKLHLPSLLLVGALLAAPSRSLASNNAPAPALPQPLALDTALAYSVEHSPTLLRTREQIRAQEGVLVEARASRLPTVGTTASVSRYDKGLLESQLYNDSDWTVDVQVKQVLYAGGALQAKNRAQSEQLEAARLAYTAALNDTLLAVRRQFYAVLLDRELIGVREEALRVLDSALANARHRREAGSGSDFDVLRAEVAVANARPALIHARNAYRTAQDQLRATLGAPAASPAAPTDLGVTGELTVARREFALADAVAAARAHRPELLQQERLARAASQSVTAAKSGYLPTVSTAVGYEWTKPSLITTTRSRLDGWTAGVQASWNIFDSRATAGRIATARAQLNAANYAVDERSLAIEVEVRQAHSALGEAEEVLGSTEKVVAQARESLRMAQARFEVGTATQLDVLSAQSALTEARANHATAQHDYAVALAALQRAMGTAATP